MKVQVAFDKRSVARYRLLGYENRMLRQKDFDNDRVDAGEIGAGHAVTAIYEVKLVTGAKGPLGELRVRYKRPAAQTSVLLERPIARGIVKPAYANASSPTRLSIVAATFAEKLRRSYWVRNLGYDRILQLFGQLPVTLRQRKDVAELHQLILTARRLDRRGDKFAQAMPIDRMSFDRVPVLK